MNKWTQVSAPRGRNGTCSLVLGVLGLMLFGWPWLPTSVDPSLRYFPVYLVVPVGIAAVVSGIGALRGMREREGADRRRAWAGTVLGSVAVMAPVGVVVWAIWAMSGTYSR
ncbi:hypothetical protein OG292_01410 [Streptomyces sp. NBC_01511]|uniref:hypothetical protein n=1 Tax=unclassified Streptomyces TaxID=2593676 RepID=UPI003863C319